LKIFAADVYHGGRCSPWAQSIHLRVTGRYRHPHVLESFHYINVAGKLKAIRHNRQKIFLDSGAFSAFTQGARISLSQYASFIQRNSDIIEIASSLDVIGEGHEQDSYNNLKELERLLGPGKVLPVHHVRDDDKWLQRYLAEGYDFIALGGMVRESTPALRLWLDHVWHHYLTNPDGTAKVKVHGFGLTTRELMFRYPWESVDSTSWVSTSNFGGVLIAFPQDDGSIKDFKIDFSDKSSARYNLKGWHFSALKPDEQDAVLAGLAELEAKRDRHPDIEAAFEKELGCAMGFNPGALGKSFGMRDLGNLAYFEKAMERRVDKFIRLQPTLWDA
jgi:hypothetical protein